MVRSCVVFHLPIADDSKYCELIEAHGGMRFGICAVPMLLKTWDGHNLLIDSAIQTFLIDLVFHEERLTQSRC